MLKRPEAGDKQSVKDLQQLYDALAPLLNLTVGPGLEMQRTPTSLIISLVPSRPVRRGVSETASTENPVVLGFTINEDDSDTWNRETNELPVTRQCITDVRWNSTTHYLQIKTRTDKFDSLGRVYDISAESEWIDAILFVECPMGG